MSLLSYTKTFVSKLKVINKKNKTKNLIYNFYFILIFNSRSCKKASILQLFNNYIEMA